MGATMFPQPLTCFEEYMLHDDRPSHPMAGIFRLRLSGRLDRGAFEAALANAVQRHPLLRATVDRKRGKRPTWKPSWRSILIFMWKATIEEIIVAQISLGSSTS